MKRRFKWWLWAIFGIATLPLDYLLTAIVWHMDTYCHCPRLADAIRKPTSKALHWYLAREPHEA